MSVTGMSARHRGHGHGHGHSIFILATHPEEIWTTNPYAVAVRSAFCTCFTCARSVRISPYTHRDSTFLWFLLLMSFICSSNILESKFNLTHETVSVCFCLIIKSAKFSIAVARSLHWFPSEVVFVSGALEARPCENMHGSSAGFKTRFH